MGEIVFWTIVRAFLTLPFILALIHFVDYELWWTLSLILLSGFVLYPTVIQYRIFKEQNKEIIESTLCSTCRHFDRSAVLCTKYDEHPTTEYIPCGGIDWEPAESNYENEEI